MANFFSADFHLGDDRLDLFPRPFETKYQCASAIRANWNEKVKPHDVAYIIGDFCVDELWLSMANEFNGRKVLIKGNYDTLPDREYLKYFQAVYDHLHLTLTDGYEKLEVNLEHYPGRSVPDKFNLVGHVHGAWRVQKNMLNVGIDANSYYPISEQQVLFFFRAIKDFYDQDVWVGNHPANTAHDERGKPGTYWETGFKGSRPET
tara:strand:- start:169 stop:783 length:615 start_codon:yes stop_codon:yes gene_type:complete